MTRTELIGRIRHTRSFLCVGLDPDLEKLPASIQNEPDALFTFCKGIIDATKEYCVAYKPNTAFFESHGPAGWEALQQVFNYIPDTHLGIADAKRGDIGNTAQHYARAFFDTMGADAITLSPYMGKDTIDPYLSYPGKWVIVLAVTSNPGAMDFQLLETEFSNKKLFEKVVTRTASWASPEQLMFVAGATQGELIGKVRALAPENFLLVPGIGAQGGSLEDVCRYAMTSDCGLLVNSSREIIYASNGSDYAEKAGEAAHKRQQEMEKLLQDYKVI